RAHAPTRLGYTTSATNHALSCNGTSTRYPNMKRPTCLVNMPRPNAPMHSSLLTSLAPTYAPTCHTHRKLKPPSSCQRTCLRLAPIASA
ncbi:unnamed protein product, partial [Dovyalis caffra]